MCVFTILEMSPRFQSIEFYNIVWGGRGGSKGALGMSTPLSPISFIFMQFSANISSNNRLVAPPLKPVILRESSQVLTCGVFLFLDFSK